MTEKGGDKRMSKERPKYAMLAMVLLLVVPTSAGPTSVEPTTERTTSAGPTSSKSISTGSTILKSTGTGSTSKGSTSTRPASAGLTSAGHTSTGHTSTGHTSTGHTSTGHTSTGHTSAGLTSTGLTSTGLTSTGLTSTGHTSTGHTSTGLTSTGLTSTGLTSTGLTSTRHTSTGHTSTGHTSTRHTSTGHTSTGHTSTGHTNIRHTSTGHTSSGHISTGQTSTGQTSRGHTSSGHTSTGHTSAASTSKGSTTSGPTNSKSTSAGSTSAASTSKGSTSSGPTSAGSTSAASTSSGSSSSKSTSTGTAIDRSTGAGSTSAVSTSKGSTSAPSTSKGSTSAPSTSKGPTSGASNSKGSTSVASTSKGSTSLGTTSAEFTIERPAIAEPTGAGSTIERPASVEPTSEVSQDTKNAYRVTQDSSTSTSTTAQQNKPRPHIIFILADDLGFNDVAFRGSNQIPTPNIDALAYGGLVLDRYYVTPVCTPTRSALLTGRLPIHNGMQHRVLFIREPRGLPLNETLLSQHLRRLGYATHLIGKWHLGFYRSEYTPLYRGFDSHLGFWSGNHDYYDHTAEKEGFWGLDMRRGMEPAWDLHGKYTTHVLTTATEELLKSHNASKPLFLLLAHAAVHSANGYQPLQAPDATIECFQHISHYKRRVYAAMVSELDKSVGRVVEALEKNNMLDNSIIIFSTDNGGPAEGLNGNWASNWPLRGVKNTLWEGGVRGAGVLWSPHVQRPGRLARQLFHVTDWLPTLYRAAGGDPTELNVPLDGVDAWEALMQDLDTERDPVLLNIDDCYGHAAIMDGDWKLVIGSTYGSLYETWLGPSGRENHQPNYSFPDVMKSPAAEAFKAIGWPLNLQTAQELRTAAMVECNDPGASASSKEDPQSSTEGPQPKHDCHPRKSPCLFNITEDPCEKNNLADRFPEILRRMQKLLADKNATAVPHSNIENEALSDPSSWNRTWTTYGDYIYDNEVTSTPDIKRGSHFRENIDPAIYTHERSETLLFSDSDQVVC